eukprot:m.108595 g.108595  ORF g.108595 m.108595 type:complete len:60 (+) comp13350_c2_seq6:2836-3015(+)
MSVNATARARARVCVCVCVVRVRVCVVMAGIFLHKTPYFTQQVGGLFNILFGRCIETGP